MQCVDTSSVLYIEEIHRVDISRLLLDDRDVIYPILLVHSVYPNPTVSNIHGKIVGY